MSKSKKLSLLLPDLEFQDLVDIQTIQDKYRQKYIGEEVPSGSLICKVLGGGKERIRNYSMSLTLKERLKELITICGKKEVAARLLNYVNY